MDRLTEGESSAALAMLDARLQAVEDVMATAAERAGTSSFINPSSLPVSPTCGHYRPRSSGENFPESVLPRNTRNPVRTFGGKQLQESGGAEIDECSIGPNYWCGNTAAPTRTLGAGAIIPAGRGHSTPPMRASPSPH